MPAESAAETATVNHDTMKSVLSWSMLQCGIKSVTLKQQCENFIRIYFTSICNKLGLIDIYALAEGGVLKSLIIIVIY